MEVTKLHSETSETDNQYNRGTMVSTLRCPVFNIIR